MKALVWVFWSVNTFFSAIYSALALTTFNAIREGTSKLIFADPSYGKSFTNSLLGSCMMGFLIVVFFMVYSFLVLISRAFGDVKLAYGVMLGTAIHTSWFMLLAALVLQNRDSDMRTNLVDQGIWSDNDLKVYQATYAFAYILVGMFILAFFILFFGRKYIGKVAGDDTIAVGSGASNAPPNAYLNMGSMQSVKGTPSMARNNQV